jgi:hypothetical protein
VLVLQRIRRRRSSGPLEVVPLSFAAHHTVKCPWLVVRYLNLRALVVAHFAGQIGILSLPIYLLLFCCRVERPWKAVFSSGFQMVRPVAEVTVSVGGFLLVFSGASVRLGRAIAGAFEMQLPPRIRPPVLQHGGGLFRSITCQRSPKSVLDLIIPPDPPPSYSGCR